MITSHEALPIFTGPIHVRRFVNHRSSAKVHWHEEIELLYFTEGEGAVSCNLREYSVKAGDIVFFNGKDLHTGCLFGDDTVYYCIHIDTDFFHNLIGDEYIVFNNIISDRECADLLDKIVDEAANCGIESLIALKKMMYEFFEMAVRSHKCSILCKEDYVKSFKRLDTFNSTIEYIDRHFDEELNVTSLANQFYISPSYFSHLFKARANKSVIEYINEVRIHHAKSYLEKEDISIRDIAGLVGFSDINYFSRKFKAVTGMTPTEYKKQIKDQR